MRKFSRRNGRMALVESEVGDGSVSFSWVSEDDPARKVLEPVTESDVSEFLLLPENEGRRGGWVVVLLGESGPRCVPDVRLARPVSRPMHTSRRLLMDGEEYEYEAPGGTANPSTWSVDFSRGGEVVRDPAVIASLLFFLKYEAEFRSSGLGTREKR